MQWSLKSSSHTFWQSEYWQNILKSSHQAHEVLVFSHAEESLLIEIRAIGMGMYGAFSLWVDPHRYSPEFFEAATRALFQKKVIFWQREEYTLEWWEGTSYEYRTYGRHFLEPWTLVVDLSVSEEEILESMHDKGRYNIRLATKRWVTSTLVEPTKENIDIWMKLLGETTKRDEFSKNSREYYEIFLSTLSKNHIWWLYFASQDSQVVAAGIFVYSGDIGIYYYGASTSDPVLRKSMAAYYLQWESIREAKRRGCKTYDLLWVAPPHDEDHHLAGVTFFKERFSSRYIRVGSKRLIILRKVPYWYFRIIRKIKKLLFR